MKSDLDISRHYTRNDLLDRLKDALATDGVDSAHWSIEALAPYDQFHGRGLEATIEIADQLSIGADDHILDIGSGIGGPARYFAHRFGCMVTGVGPDPRILRRRPRTDAGARSRGQGQARGRQCLGDAIS